MNPFVTRIFLFAAGLAVFMMAGNVYYEIRVRQADDFFRQVAWFRDPTVKPVVLFIGDSRMAMNLNPRRLPPGYYDFSYPGETLRHMYLRAKFALETKPSIRYLVLGLEDITLSEARARLREVNRQMLFADLVDLTEAYPASPRFLLRSATLHYLPLINASHRARTAEAFADDLRWVLTGEVPSTPKRLVCGGFQFSEEDHPWAELEREHWRAKAVAHVDELLGTSNDVPEMREVFERLLALAEYHGVKVIGVRNPLSRTYIRAARDYDTASVRAFFENSPLHAMLDYENLYVDKPTYFVDADHLRTHAAARFTDRLVSDLRELVSVEQNVPAPCKLEVADAAPGWPYNDVLSAWLRNPDCHNLGGECGTAPGLPASGPQYADEPASNAEGPPIDDPENPWASQSSRTSQGVE